jgi:hypothetical protein
MVVGKLIKLFLKSIKANKKFKFFQDKKNLYLIIYKSNPKYFQKENFLY